MELDVQLLKYADTHVVVCLSNKTKRQVHDILRAIYVYGNRIRVCPCVSDPWVRQSLTFLNAQVNNEPSDQCGRPRTD
jgi:hypothetical protein